MNKFLQKIGNGDFDIFINGAALMGLIVVSTIISNTITNKICNMTEIKLKEREALGYDRGCRDGIRSCREMQRMETCITKDKA